MGWAFYELSGGADYTPPPRPETAIAEAKPVSRPAAAQPARTERPSQAASLVAAPAIKPRLEPARSPAEVSTCPTISSS